MLYLYGMLCIIVNNWEICEMKQLLHSYKIGVRGMQCVLHAIAGLNRLVRPDGNQTILMKHLLSFPKQGFELGRKTGI